jgi:hypothetical protein
MAKKIDSTLGISPTRRVYNIPGTFPDTSTQTLIRST